MPSHLLLAGGNEFQSQMAPADRRAIQLAGGPAAPIRIIPAAAAPDHNHRRAGASGVRWFRSLGAQDVAALPLIDPASAADPAICAELRAARLIYLLGGFPRHLGETLAGSPAAEAMRAAHAAGALIAGSSAGAMVLCEAYYDPYAGAVCPGLGFVPGACVIPHYNRFGAGWLPALRPLIPGLTLIGIDEHTAAIDDGPDPRWPWQAYGPGQARAV